MRVAAGRRQEGIEEVLSDWRAWLADRLAEGRGEVLEGSKRELAARLIRQRLDELARKAIAAGREGFSKQEELELETRLLDEMFGLGRLQRFIEDPDVENIDVNGAHCAWVTRSGGRKEMVGSIAGSDEELVQLIRSAASRFGLSERRFDQGCPELDMRLPDGSRLSALMAVCTSPAVSIRRHRYTDVGLGDLVDLGMMDEHLASFLAAAVRARKNIIVSGGMNVGKTTLLRALAAEIPLEERIVTIEQAMELGLDAIPSLHPDIVALEAREPNSEGEGGFTMAMLVRRALRMNADRVIVGEVLGSEVIVMLNAMSQGRAGSMCTIHSDSSLGVFRRIASYAAQASERLPVEATNLLIAGSIHFVVHVDLVPTDAVRGSGRQRAVVSVREVVDAEGLQVISNEVFRPGPGGRAIPGAPMRSKTLEDLIECGYEPLGREGDFQSTPCSLRRLSDGDRGRFASQGEFSTQGRSGAAGIETVEFSSKESLSGTNTDAGLTASGAKSSAGTVEIELENPGDDWDEALEEIFEPLEGGKRTGSLGSFLKKAFGHGDGFEDTSEEAEQSTDPSVQILRNPAAPVGIDYLVAHESVPSEQEGEVSAVAERKEVARSTREDGVSRRITELLGVMEPSFEQGPTSRDTIAPPEGQGVRYCRGWR